jgi:hypothetical protein
MIRVLWIAWTGTATGFVIKVFVTEPSHSTATAINANTVNSSYLLMEPVGNTKPHTSLEEAPSLLKGQLSRSKYIANILRRPEVLSMVERPDRIL